MTDEEARLCAAVDDFALEMKAKLCAKARQGWHSWSDPAFAPNIADLLAQKVDEGEGSVWTLQISQ